MNMSKQQSWERFKKYYLESPKLGLAGDLSRMNVSDELLATIEPCIQKTFVSIAALDNSLVVPEAEGTNDTRNGMLEAKAAAGLYFGKHAVAVATKLDQRICVFSNKVSTGQHSNLHNIRYETSNFVVTFVEVLVGQEEKSLFLELNARSSDYLHGSYLETTQTLAKNGRESIAISIRDTTAEGSFQPRYFTT